jgi:hypothetical protein
MPLSSPAPPTPKRRLTVLNNTEANADPTGDGSAPRRPWQWAGFGALAIFTVWIPLAGLAGVAAARLGESAFTGAGIAIVAVYAAALALGAALGGFLVGRWGTAGAGLREAALAGLGASAVAVVITWVSFGPSGGTLLVAAVATPMAAAGGRLGLRARRR